jgi:hypothetical protein
MLEIRAGLRQEIMAELSQGIKARQRQEGKERTLTGDKKIRARYRKEKRTRLW